MFARTLRILSVAAFLGPAGYGALGRAQAAEPTCTRWDESDASRCFDCMREVMTPYGLRRINTCPPRVFLPGYRYGWYPPG